MLLMVLLVAIATAALQVVTGQPILANVLHHLRWWAFCWQFRIFGRDTKKPKSPPPKIAPTTRKVRIVFVRHGDSEWNALFNRFGLGWPVRFAKFVLNSVRFWLFCRDDDVLIDAALSAKGVQQAEALAAYARNPGSAFPRDPATSVVVSSNLRRAMATALLGLKPRLADTREKVIIDSTLQEGSNNPDAHSFMTRAYHLSDSPVLTYATAPALARVFDPVFNGGNKAIDANVYSRIDTFARRVMADGSGDDKPYRCVEPPQSSTDLAGLATAAAATKPWGQVPTDVIVVGHSLWIRGFFWRFLPAGTKHPAANKKLQNCAAVECWLYAAPDGTLKVDEASVKILHSNYVGVK